MEVARNLYDQLEKVSYVPCAVTLPGDAPVAPGQILPVVDGKGRVATLYVMDTEFSGQRLTVKCQGTGLRDGAAVVNDQSYQALSGKLMELHAHVDGLRATNRDQQGNQAQLELKLEGVEARVQKQQGSLDQVQTQMTVVHQQATELSLEVKKLRQEGAQQVVTGLGYRFTDEGLRIGSLGGGMENLVDDTGMYVSRAGQVLLQADSAGVQATDVTVRSYLQVGQHARFEDYANGRTACYYT